tara:strand:+ start:337 stop:1239 length:903 start_codon:yes stop_codon:yes gene_type:complete
MWRIVLSRILPVLLLILSGGGVLAGAQALPEGWDALLLSGRKFRVIDGDTFDADLNGDGRLAKTRERIRLLYVDTPELSKSRKGKDVGLGKPAKAFLTEVLEGRRIRLWVNPDYSRGNHGRLLGVLEVDGRNVNLGLIAQGHSYFDTRFLFPEDYVTYARAEVTAFERQRGIWGTQDSRKRYLQRLRREGKTVYSAKNPWFRIRKIPVRSIHLPKWQDRFVRVEGTIQKIRKLRKGAKLVYLEHDQIRSGVPVITFENQRRWQKLESLKRGKSVLIEGFVSQYKQEWQIRLHRGVQLDLE